MIHWLSRWLLWLAIWAGGSWLMLQMNTARLADAKRIRTFANRPLSTYTSGTLFKSFFHHNPNCRTRSGSWRKRLSMISAGFSLQISSPLLGPQLTGSNPSNFSSIPQLEMLDLKMISLPPSSNGAMAISSLPSNCYITTTWPEACHPPTEPKIPHPTDACP